MMNLYIQINILIAMAWILFQLLPQMKSSYRLRKTLAQTLLAGSILAMPLMYALPDFTFPDLMPQQKVNYGRAIDVDTYTKTPMQKAVQTATLAAAEPPWHVESSPDILLSLFALGMAGMFAKRIRDLFQLRSLLKNTMPIHKIGRTRIAITEGSEVPFSVMFGRKAYVVLPASLVPHREDFKIALKHEIEHHRRKDTTWAIVLEWLTCGFYLNPAIYLWRKTILQLQELACDEALIGRMGISKAAYGSCLLRVAEMALGQRFVHAGTVCMIPESDNNGHSFLRRRITMFAQHERSTAKKAASVALGTIAVSILLTGAYVAQAAVRSTGGINPGKAIYDSRIQPIAEDALKKGMKEHGATAGFAIVADPVRGTILAVANINNGFDEKLKGDWALSYSLEPGSALKPLIVASALQHQKTKIDEIHNCENGVYALGSMMTHDTESYDKLSTMDTVVQSSNICTIKIGQKLGAKGIENSLREFGVGKDGTTWDFPGARFGFVPPAGKIPDDNYIALMSQGVANRTDLNMTPLEMVQAYSAIANGGRLMKSIGADGRQDPTMIRDVLSKEVAAEMRETLRKVVVAGTGQRINFGSIPLAGKTSSVIINGNQRVGGFIGYAPADHPKVIVYVVMFDMKGQNKYGSTTAAPVFRDIAEKTVAIFNP